jgi:hypothetical protein
MMSRKTVRSSMMVAALCLSSVAARAEGLKFNPKFDVFVMGGESTVVDTTYFTSAVERYRSSYVTAPAYVVGVEVPLSKILALETRFSSGHNDLRVTNTSLSPHKTIQYGVRNNVGSVGLVARAPFSRWGFHPYAAVGWDYHRYAPTLAGKKEAESQGFGAVAATTLVLMDKLGLNCGGGLERGVSRRISLRLDVRDHLSGSPTFGLPSQSTISAIFPAKGLAQNLAYSVGIVVHLGKKK